MTRVLCEAGAAHLCDTATLLVGELVANAVRHGRPPVELTVTLGDGRVTIAVGDHGRAAPPRARTEDLVATSGRGLHIVATLAESWGTASGTPGTTVWFTLPVS